MQIPVLYELPRLIAESGYTEDEVLNRGLEAEGLVFMVVVPELGACRVPHVALSHFMAGADEYAADGMPEHWSKQPSGPWTIKRDRLRILADSWEKHLNLIDRVQDALERQQTDNEAAHLEHETVEQRRIRYLDLFEAEERKGKRGALQRAADLARADRSNFGKDVKKARAARADKRRAGSFVTQLVRDGKR